MRWLYETLDETIQSFSIYIALLASALYRPGVTWLYNSTSVLSS